MKTVKNITALAFMTLLFIGFGTSAKAQTATIWVYNATSCDLIVQPGGNYVTTACGFTSDAIGLVPAKTRVQMTFTDRVTNAPIPAICRGVRAWPPAGGSMGEIDDCAGTAFPGGSACGAFNITKTYVPGGQFVYIN